MKVGIAGDVAVVNLRSYPQIEGVFAVCENEDVVIGRNVFFLYGDDFCGHHLSFHGGAMRHHRKEQNEDHSDDDVPEPRIPGSLIKSLARGLPSLISFFGIQGV